MSYHKLLQRQINKYLVKEGSDVAHDAQLTQFLKAINDSYVAFEKDISLADHAFKISEEEFFEINQTLENEKQVRNSSVKKLKDTINNISGSLITKDEDDLLKIADYLNAQILKRKHAETIFLSIAENSNNGILLENENREVIFVNKKFCDFLNLQLAPESLMGVDGSTLVDMSKQLFADPKKYTKTIHKLLKNQHLKINEMIYLVDGRVFSRDFIPVMSDDQYKGQIWMYTDVTSRENSRIALEKSEMRHRQIMNASLDAIILINHLGNIIFWNNRAESIFGWTKEEAIGKNLAETIIPLEYREAHKAGMKRYFETNEGPVLQKLMELLAIKKTGEEFPVEVTIIPTDFDGSVVFCGFLRDISQRKAAEQAIKIKEEKYRSIITNMNLGLLEVDNEDIIQFANKSFTNLSGYGLEELIGRKAIDIFLEQKDVHAFKDIEKQRQKGLSDAYELKIKNKKQEARWWLISGAPLYDDLGHRTGSIGIHLDITDQKKTEIALLASREQAELLAKAKQNFLANMSHEIRTPISAVLGMVNELQRTTLDTKQAFYVDTISKASDNLLAIINDILDLSKIEAGKLQMEKIPFDIRKTLQSSLQILRYRAEEKGLRLNLHLDDELPKVLIGDPHRLNQILLNLISNALKFTDKGGVDVFVSVRSIEYGNLMLKIMVKDTGVGMDANFLKSLFSKFIQEYASIGRRYGGTGLGMNITKTLTELMGGNIDVKSKKNEGTTVKINLPFVVGKEEDLNQDKLSDVDFTLLKHRKVLVVEDNELNRLVAANVLQHFDIYFEEAFDGLEAIKILEEKCDFDVILMDLQMPEMNGFDATLYIRNTMKLDTPIIALTANVIKGEIDRCLEVGMNDYLSKPYTEVDFVYCIYKNIFGIPTDSLEDEDLNGANANQLPETPLFDLKIINDIGRGNTDFVNKMISIFIVNTPETMHNMQEAFELKDYEKIGKLAHKIKPSIINLCIHSLNQDIATLEGLSWAVNVSDDEISTMISHCKEVIEKVVVQMKEML